MNKASPIAGCLAAWSTVAAWSQTPPPAPRSAPDWGAVPAASPGAPSPGTMVRPALSKPSLGAEAFGVRAPAAASPSNSWSLNTPSARSAGAGLSVSSIAQQRLRAAGLDAASPDFQSRLNSRLQAIGAAARSVHTVSAGLHAGLANAPESVQRIATYANSPHRSLGGNAIHAAAAAASASMQPDGLFDANGSSVNPQLQPIVLPSVYALTFNSPSAPVPPGPEATLHFSIPACGVEADASAQVALTNSTWLGNPAIRLPSSAGPYAAVFVQDGDPSAGAHALPLGNGRRAGVLTLHWGDRVSPPMNAQFAAASASQAYSATVADTAPMLVAPNALGLSASAANLSAPTVQRLNLGATPMTGTDVVGLGVAVGSGYTASAQIVAAHSVADLGGDASPDNTYRGAAVTQQPSSSRLQTTVQWHIGPGDSLQYEIQWTFTGPSGQRVVSTLPLGGACDT